MPLQQQGPWQGNDLTIDKSWIKNAFAEKIHSIDWEHARTDVMPFLGKVDKQGLEVWSDDFFTKKLTTLIEYLE
tara:strand:- start:10593 stop:10814 length:222 start_codon:yes stop_codon:yes gene_type:complete